MTLDMEVEAVTFYGRFVFDRIGADYFSTERAHFTRTSSSVDMGRPLTWERARSDSSPRLILQGGRGDEVKRRVRRRH